MSLQPTESGRRRVGKPLCPHGNYEQYYRAASSFEKGGLRGIYACEISLAPIFKGGNNSVLKTVLV